MAFPFGGHPTLGRFLEFVVECGCTHQMLVRVSKAGRAFQVLEIRNGNGAILPITEPDMNERLMPATISNYQRRLGIKTPFASQPEQPSPSPSP